MKSVRIQMDDTFVFYMDDHDFPTYPSTDSEGPTIKVPEEFYDRYIKTIRAFYDMNAQIEQLYRIQLGKEPWPTAVIPEHEVIDDQSTKT